MSVQKRNIFTNIHTKINNPTEIIIFTNSCLKAMCFNSKLNAKKCIHTAAISIISVPPVHQKYQILKPKESINIKQCANYKFHYSNLFLTQWY